METIESENHLYRSQLDTNVLSICALASGTPTVLMLLEDDFMINNFNMVLISVTVISIFLSLFTIKRLIVYEDFFILEYLIRKPKKIDFESVVKLRFHYNMGNSELSIKYLGNCKKKTSHFFTTPKKFRKLSSVLEGLEVGFPIEIVTR